MKPKIPEDKLSKRAQKTLALIRQGRFYQCYDPRLPDSINELEANGFIKRAARPMVFVAAYVPTQGYTPYRPERFDNVVSETT